MVGLLSRLLRASPATLFTLALLGGPAEGQEKPTLTPEDYGQFERLGGAVLSPDGAWLANTVSRVDETSELQVRPVSDPDSVITVAYGSGPTFSDDARWLAFSIGVSEEERDGAREQRRQVRDQMGLVDLESGELVEIDDVDSFSFSADSRFIALRRYASEGDREAEGVDLVVRDLDAVSQINFGNVSEYAWQDEGALLAMVVDAEGMAGNGVQTYDAATGRISTLDSRETRYSGLAWREDASDLAVLRMVDPGSDAESEWADTTHTVLAFNGLSSGSGASLVFDPATASGFPAGHRVVGWEPLRWSDDGASLFFGIKARTAVDPCDRPDDDEEEMEVVGQGDEHPVADEDSDDACQEEDERPTVEIWHAVDVDIVPTQKVQANRDRRDNDLSVWHLAEDRFVQLENELTETVRLDPALDLALGLDQTPYEGERMFGPVYNDVYVIDVETGEREKVLDRIQYLNGLSDGGRYVLWLENDHYWTYDVETGERTDLTSNLPTSFIDVEDDHTVQQKPPFGMAGWLEDDRAVLLYDEYDLWMVQPDGSGANPMTSGASENMRFRRVRIDPDEEAVVPGEPQFFTIYDDWTEEWGYARADRLGADTHTLLWAEARISSLRKADDADVFLYRQESFEDSPDYFVAENEHLRGGKQMTQTNVFQSDYAWGRAELVEFQNDWGEELQGSLFYPANYQAGQQYPMIVYIYEIVSNGVRSYHIPSERDYYDFQDWIQNGYFVFQPDIVYRDRNPGLSAVASLEPAVQTMIGTGMIDPDGVGLIGHSWGGYQTTFTVTQTDIFAAGVAGAPLTNLFSMYLSVYWNSGGTDARIFEISQGRMEVPFWEDEASYRANSPVYHIENMNTPLLMAQGTEDGAVEFNQGVEFYNAARRAGKDFVFLVYNGENHGFSQEENQLDYHRRIREWFDHHLKHEPAADWIDSGVPFLEQPGGTPERDGRSGG